jgi:hypothetical protein
MRAVPLHIQRRLEQRWASRFTAPAASNASKDVGTKPTCQNQLVARGAAKTKEKPAGLSPNSALRGKFHRRIDRLLMRRPAFPVSVERVRQAEQTRRSLPQVETEPP